MYVIENGDWFEVWFENKNNDKAMFARYADIDLVDAVVCEYDAWKDAEFESTNERVFSFIPNDIYDFIWGAFEEEWDALHFDVSA